MHIFLIAFVVFFTSLSAKVSTNITKKERMKIEAILDKQEKAWNEGNLEKFMETYWKSEQLVFVGGHGPTYGWQTTLDNYKKGYPNKAAMGKLNFKMLNISKIDTKTFFVIGRFQLTRYIGNVAGHFTLVIQKIDDKWLIISDHSSTE